MIVIHMLAEKIHTLGIGLTYTYTLAIAIK